MYKRGRSWLVCLMLLLCGLCMSACSGEELLAEIPQTFQIVVEEEETEEEPEKEQESEQIPEQTPEQTLRRAKGGAAEEKTEQSEVIDSLFLMAETSHFAYNSLSQDWQLWYRDIEQALGNMEETVRLSDEGLAAGLDESCIDTIFQCVLNDHPEIFYVDGYTYTKYMRNGEVVAISFSGAYQLSKEEALQKKKEIQQAVKEVLRGISPNASAYEKVKYVFETIIRNTDYDLNAPDNQNVYSVFVGKSSVCQGYAKATQYLLNQLGIECTLVQGTVENGEGHAWNLVRVDGSYYYIDTTWGDASYRLEDGTDTAIGYLPEINYDYFCVTTKQLLQTHTLDNVVPVPECVDTAANYYVRQGALFTAYDKDQMKRLFENASQQQLPDVTVKCVDLCCYEEIMDALIEKQEIFDYILGDCSQVSYAHNEKQLSLTFWVTNQ